MKLLTKININTLIIKIVLPLNEEGPKRVLNSSCNLFITEHKTIKNLFGINQYVGIKIKENKIELAQLSGKFIEDEGSNTENKLVIIIFN